MLWSSTVPHYSIIRDDSFRLMHLTGHAVFSLDLDYITPVVDLGITGTGFWMNGNVWDQNFPVTRGDARSENGSTGNVTFGVGSSINAGAAILFVGIKGGADVVYTQLSLGMRF